MNIIDIIVKKKNSFKLTKEEIEYAVNGYLKEEIKDYQMSSLLMAIVINGMDLEETINLTDVMINSGDKLDLSEIGKVVDKHSTGGVGDKTTLVLAPLVASVGVNVAKMSGRGLGHTGGTIDKLESISGFKVSLSREEFIKQIKDIGVSIISQTGDIAKADKKIYALRDVTGTTESIPLIASSIMSKKIASGADYIVIDVKVGNGALMKNIEAAKELSRYMIEIGKHYNKKVVCVLTNMNMPLGFSIGNGLEVIESINCLKGKGPKKLEELVLVLGSIMVSLVKNIDEKEAYDMLKANIENEKGYEKFKELVNYQNGNIDNISMSEKQISIKSSKEGFITDIDTQKLGEIVKNIGGGRISKEDKIDYSVGMILNKTVGDLVFENEELLKIYLNDKDVKLQDILDCFKIEDEIKVQNDLILEIIK